MQFRDPTRVLGSGVAGVLGASLLTRQCVGDSCLIGPRNLRAGGPVESGIFRPKCHP